VRYDAAMRIRLVVPTLLVVLVAACGGGSGTASSPNPTAPASQASAGQPASVAPSAGKGKVDCAAITTAAQELLSVQLLAQMRTPDAVTSIKSKEIGSLDVDRFLAAMHALHALDTYSSPLGDPKAAIDFYERAGEAARTLLATDPPTQAAIDTYLKSVGTVGDFIGHQMAISGAIGAAGC
jgi:hypothetical protein